MRRNFIASLLALMAVGLCACNDDVPDASDVAVLVTPSSTEKVELASSDKQIYNLMLYSKENQVNRLRVKSVDALYGETVLLDTTFASKPSDLDFIYTAPLIDRDSLAVTLTFSAWDTAGHECNVKRELTIKNKEVLISEKSGIVLYAPQTGRADALALSNVSQTFNWQSSADSVNADVYIETNEDFDEVRLCSRTGAKFVRINSFDYAAATANSIQAVFAGSVRTDAVNDLRINDIVLIGHNGVAEAAMRVQNVIRTGETSERCLQLAFKTITRK